MAEMPKPEPMLRNERLLRGKVCCSAAWADAVLTAIRAGKTVTEFYPPGGKAETGMRQCPDCGKWCPPNIISPSCCDCELERCWERLESPARKDLWPELRRLWWPRARPFTELVGRILQVCRQFGPAIQTEDHLERVMNEVYGFDTLGKEDADSLPEETGNVFYLHGAGDEGTVCPEEWCLGEEGPRKRADAAPYLASARIALSRLRNNIRRHIALGCQLPLLDENDQSLRKEIEHYHGKHPAVQPDVEDFLRADIAEYWIALGVIQSAAEPNYRIRKKSSRPVAR